VRVLVCVTFHRLVHPHVRVPVVDGSDHVIVFMLMFVVMVTMLRVFMSHAGPRAQRRPMFDSSATPHTLPRSRCRC
jgi:hypothetical protein